ncbi:hypothetical protein DRQ26_07205 [bacterium]|nr:MAG: hypothetical protein DRQ26_07205 [bacterium]
MTIKPMYIFDATTDTGIDKVPVDATITIKDSDGAGTASQVVKLANTGMTGTSTIADFLADETLFRSISSSGGSSEPIEELSAGTY